MEKVINILGEKYQLIESDESENAKMKGADGFAEFYSKKLFIDKSLNEEHELHWEDIGEYKKKVIRHEIMHAFFHESGLSECAKDEDLVEFLAIQLPKIFKLMNNIDVL